MTEEPAEVQLNRDHHTCLRCDAQVTAVSADGVNEPCGHRAPTRVTRKDGTS